MKRGLNHPKWKPLGIPFAMTPLGQLHQSSPSPVPGDRARGIRRGFSPCGAQYGGALAPEPLRATGVGPEFPRVFFSLFSTDFAGVAGFSGQFSGIFEIGRLPLDFFEIRHSYV